MKTLKINLEGAFIKDSSGKAHRISLLGFDCWIQKSLIKHIKNGLQLCAPKDYNFKLQTYKPKPKNEIVTCKEIAELADLQKYLKEQPCNNYLK